jgi:hypothetical protein
MQEFLFRTSDFRIRFLGRLPQCHRRAPRIRCSRALALVTTALWLWPWSHLGIAAAGKLVSWKIMMTAPVARTRVRAHEEIRACHARDFPGRKHFNQP